MLKQGTLIYLLILVVYVHGQDKSFKVNGTLAFPKTGVYTHIPDGSCLTLRVAETRMDDGHNDISGEIVVRQFQFNKNELAYEIDCQHLLPAYLSVSAVLNVGWCGEHKDEWIRAGDYYNAFGYDFFVESNDTLKSVNMELELYKSPVHGQDKNFKVNGTLAFPKTGVYTHIPDGSCLTLRVAETRMDDGHNDISGEMVVRQFQFNKNELAYEIDCQHLLPAYLSVSAVLNVGWCGEHTDEWIRKGDYYNAFGYDFFVESNDTLKSVNMEVELYKSPELCGKHRCSGKYQCRVDEKGDGYCECKDAFNCPKTTSTTTTSTTTTKDPGMVFGDSIRLDGAVILPSQGHYESLPEGSCLYLKVEDNADCMDMCKRNIVYTKFIYGVSIVNKQIPYDFKLYGLKSGSYSISAVLNVGWCPEDRRSLNIRNGDYHNDVSHVFEVTWGEQHTKEDIKMVPMKQYMCGDRLCYEKEVCNVHDNTTSCVCMGVACGDLIEPEWVCGSDGQSYVSECWMKMTDCFSGTIWKVHDGECNKKKGHSWLSQHEYSVSLPIAGIAMILIIAVILLMIRHRKQSVKSLPDKPPAYENVDSNKKSPTKENVFIDIASPVYGKPPEYQEFADVSKTPTQEKTPVA